MLAADAAVTAARSDACLPCPVPRQHVCVNVQAHAHAYCSMAAYELEPFAISTCTEGKPLASRGRPIAVLR